MLRSLVFNEVQNFIETNTAQIGALDNRFISTTTSAPTSSSACGRIANARIFNDR